MKYVRTIQLDGPVPLTRQLINWDGPGYELGKKSGEWDRGPSARQEIGIWACELNYPCHSPELSNPTSYYPLLLGSRIGDKIFESLNRCYHFMDHVI